MSDMDVKVMINRSRIVGDLNTCASMINLTSQILNFLGQGEKNMNMLVIKHKTNMVNALDNSSTLYDLNREDH